MKTYEATAKTVEEAISAGLNALSAAISDVKVEIIDEGSKGLFGLFGSRLARVRLTMKEMEEDPLAELTRPKPVVRKPVEPKPERKPEPKAEPQKEAKAEPKAETKPESKIETKPEPVKPILGSDQQVGVLKMNYQFINPANSYLTENPAGKVILFSDDTVELAPSEMNITNELNGWINKGVFYLFEVEVDGKIVDPQWDKLPAGHHYITATIRRPVVKNMGNGSYIILSKGHIRMSK